jgi:hypothetical protein
MPGVVFNSTEQSVPAETGNWRNHKITEKNSRKRASNYFHFFIFFADFVFFKANLWA